MLKIHQIKTPGIGLVYFWSRNLKVIKSNLLGLVFSTSGAKAGKSSNLVSWESLCRFLDPRMESHQIKLPGIRFVGFIDFLSQGRKVIKSRFLGMVFLTSGAKARKSSNRVFRDSLCRLLEPRLKALWIRGSFYYRIMVYCVIFMGCPIYSTSQRRTHEKYASTHRCFHNNSSAAAVTSHTLLWPAESVLHEV